MNSFRHNSFFRWILLGTILSSDEFFLAQFFLQVNSFGHNSFFRWIFFGTILSSGEFFLAQHFLHVHSFWHNSFCIILAQHFLQVHSFSIQISTDAFCTTHFGDATLFTTFFTFEFFFTLGYRGNEVRKKDWKPSLLTHWFCKGYQPIRKVQTFGIWMSSTTASVFYVFPLPWIFFRKGAFTVQ